MNIPPDIFNRMQGMAQPQQGGTFTVSGKPYNGPFGNNTTTPFRTVDGIGQYGNGLNSSASQIYEHFSGAQNAMGRKYREHGLKPINPKTQIQSMEDFANRGALAGPASGGSGPLQWDGLKNNSDVLRFMQQENALSGSDLDWMGRWFGESGIGGGKDFLTGNVRGWDYQGSGLTDQNKGIVGNAMNYLGNYWKPFEQQGAGMPADPPKSPMAAGGIFNMNPLMRGMR